ncbi:hypothetical protein I4U23_026870 [Adineta vaga]|nr:hypothetical protein I4U23_026870 [Adineta vaga]
MCPSFDNKLQFFQETLSTKSNDLIKRADEQFKLVQELNLTKESARTVIECLNASLKASCHVIARTVIEVILQQKDVDIVTTFVHPKFGSMFDQREQIEKSFFNLYQTLSEAVHDGNLLYEEDMLPIPDLNETRFTKSDTLALSKL